MEHIAEMEEFKICVCAIMHSYWFSRDVFSCTNLKTLQPWKSKAKKLADKFQPSALPILPFFVQKG